MCQVNLLVVGAARSGTTALISSLKQHSDVWVTTPKETNFFAFACDSQRKFNGPGDDEMIVRSMIIDPTEFEKQIQDGRGFKIRIEGSVSTLYYHATSVQNITRYADPNAKIIILLRSPVDRAYSSYLYLWSPGP